MRHSRITSLLRFLITSAALCGGVAVHGEMVQEDTDRKFTQTFISNVSKAQHLVASSDTLWNISERLKPDGLSVWQTMDGVYSKNSSAFLDDDPSKVIVGSIIEIPTAAYIGSQSGILIAQILDLDVYKVKDYSSKEKREHAVEDSTNLPNGKSSNDLKIPYFEVSDLVLSSKATEFRDGSVDENLTNSDNSKSLIKSNETQLIERIDMLSAEIELLEAMVITERDEKAKALAEARRSWSINSKRSWIEFVESKIILTLILLMALVSLFIVRKKSSLQQRTDNDEIAGIDEDIFVGNNESIATVFDNDFENPTDTEGFEFTDDFNPELSMDLDYLDSSENINPVDVKLDLAETYADLGDITGAREILQEIISESNREGKVRATEVLEKLNAEFPDQ